MQSIESVPAKLRNNVKITIDFRGYCHDWWPSKSNESKNESTYLKS